MAPVEGQTVASTAPMLWRGGRVQTPNSPQNGVTLAPWSVSRRQAGELRKDRRRRHRHLRSPVDTTDGQRATMECDTLPVSPGDTLGPGGTADRGDPQELPQPISAAPELPAVSAEASKPYQRDFEPRRVYITRANLEQFGYTTGCPACDETRAGARSAGVSHTDVCRRRHEQALANDPAQSARIGRA